MNFQSLHSEAQESVSPRPLWDGRSLQHRETDLTLYGVVSSPHCLPARFELTEGSGRRCLDGGRNQTSGWGGGVSQFGLTTPW